MTMRLVEAWREWLRWVLSGAVIMLLHGAVAAAIIHWSDDEVSMPTAAMVVDIAPFPMAPPESTTDLPPGPQQVEAEASTQTPVTEAKEEIEEKLETSQSKETQPELAPAINPEVALDTAPPKPEQKVATPQENQLPAPETTAPPQMSQLQSAAIAAAPVQGPPTADRSDAIPTWRSAVAALLERNKRYPADGRNHRGTAQVAFSIDRQGRVVSSHVATTSGSEALDRAALDMIKRAQPFPPPPAGLPGPEISLTVPVRFNVR